MNNDAKILRLIAELRKSNYKKQIKIRCKANRTDSYSLYFDIWRNGKREYRFLKYYLFPGKSPQNVQTIREVINIRDKEELELIRADNDFTLSNWKKKGNFIQYLESLVKTKSTPTWRGCLLNIKEFTNGFISFANLDDKFIESFAKYLLTKIKPNSASVYLNILSTAINIAIRDKIISYNPVKSIKKPKHDTERQFLTHEEIILLLNTPCRNQIVKDVFLFSYYTGLRISDIYLLKWDNIQGNEISIRMKKTKEPIRIPLHPEAEKILASIDKSHEKIFYRLPNHSTVNFTIKDWISASGIKKSISMHSARHSFATTCLSSDIDIFTVSKLLGHSNLSTTQIYAKLVDKKKQEAISKLPGLTKKDDSDK